VFNLNHSDLCIRGGFWAGNDLDAPMQTDSFQANPLGCGHSADFSALLTPHVSIQMNDLASRKSDRDRKISVITIT
jgi:hypothetical protein